MILRSLLLAAGINLFVICHSLSAQNLTIARNDSATLDNATADQILSQGSSSIGIGGTPGATCSLNFQRSGDVSTYHFDNGSINSQADFDTLCSGSPGFVTVVNQINFCGATSPNIIGCAPLQGHCMAVVRYTPDQEWILWMHEYGHTKGLVHSQDQSSLMYPVIDPSHTTVTGLQCADIQNLAVSDTNGPLQASSSVAALPIERFVHTTFIEGVPFSQASAYGSSSVPVLLKMLGDPAEKAFYSNIAVVLGMIGDSRATQRLIHLVLEGTGTMDPASYRAKTSALISLGYIVNKANDRSAMAFLTESIQTDIWKRRKITWDSPFVHESESRDLDLTKAAILGLALSGKAAARETVIGFQADAQKRLEPNKYRELQSTIETALAEHSKIAKYGLSEYYRLAANAKPR